MIPKSLPDTLVHYAIGAPFRSIMAAVADGHVIDDLHAVRAAGRFSDPDYIPRRKVVEHQLRQTWLKLGGEAPLSHPLYFTLGRHPGYESPATQGLVGYEVPLSCLPSRCVSWTFGDSLICFDPTYRAIVRERGKYGSASCGTLYALPDLERVRGQVALEPQVGWEHGRPFHQVVEVQVWAKPNPADVRAIE